MILIRKSPCYRQVIVLWYVNLAVAGHKKPSQIALGGGKNLIAHFFSFKYLKGYWNFCLASI